MKRLRCHMTGLKVSLCGFLKTVCLPDLHFSPLVDDLFCHTLLSVRCRPFHLSYAPSSGIRENLWRYAAARYRVHRFISPIKKHFHGPCRSTDQ